MEINKKLNLVIPLERGDGATIYAYSMPIDRALFERYYKIFAKCFSEIYGSGLGIMSAPRVALMIMRDAAKELGVWDGPEGAEHGLVNEIRRLTYVIALTERGWEPVPWHEAITRKLIDDDEISEVENAIAFFTVAWHYHRRSDRKGILEGASKLWGGHLESLSYTEFCAYLPTSTEDAISRTRPHFNSGVQPTQNPAPMGQDIGVIQIPI